MQEAPVQQAMGMDIFQGNQKIMVKQEFALLECFSCEAKNRYRVSVPNGEEEGPNIFLYVNEESNCCERICCSVNRSLTLNVHQGATKEGPIVQSMYKPFHVQGCCICRPKFDVFDGARAPIGTIEDPCRCCAMDQQIKDAGGKLIFTTYGSICQLGLCCPCCASVDFNVKKDGNDVALISKRPMTCGECIKKTNRFIVDFDKINDANEKRLIFAAAMLADLEYFEQNKNDNGGGA
eukprot:TRINITY_DN1364_c0_g1_i1.p1 TRINITY_DN1364_c0_g1~~TRINITY_DN1364_c0_g1_i1.p1  ORF type:complete len:257 (-),score=60.11 TRINITY_DN1364_c0_g1_i1:73-780(-)